MLRAIHDLGLSLQTIEGPDEVARQKLHQGMHTLALAAQKAVTGHTEWKDAVEGWDGAARFIDTIDCIDKTASDIGDYMAGFGIPDPGKPYRRRTISKWAAEDFDKERTITREVDVSDAVPAGETVRAWIPYPQALPGHQEDIRFIASEPAVHEIAPESAPQRTVYLEKPARAGEPTGFLVTYELTIFGQYHDIDPDRVVAAGITRTRLPADNEVVCTLRDSQVPDLAAKMGDTRSAAALELWGDKLDGAVVAIGNAPTALFHLLNMIEAGAPRPAAIVGGPVGFIGAAESKEALIEHPSRIDYLVVRGRRGGSDITASAVNAIASDVE